MQGIFATRNLTDLVNGINNLQLAEKEKLMLVAAYHLDQMQKFIPTLQVISGNCDLQKDYLRDKIAETESNIREALDEIIACKIDLLDEST